MMGQLKIYGHADVIADHRQALSDALHRALVDAFAYPAEKRFHRFFPVADADFLYPADRSRNYLIVEVTLFPGRSTDAKKAFYRAALANLGALGFDPVDVEIVLVESPRENWSIRGVPGDELGLGYKVEV
jgi:phenylpyruvate tautomerase PptA (4-oxalocrotonate tautomerase family)